MALPSHWWKERGDFVDALHAATAGDSGGESGGSCWVWLSESESRATLERIRASNEGEEETLAAWIREEALDACRVMRDRSVPLAARAELRGDRLMRKLHRPTLFGDPARPEQIFLALDESMPAPLWVPAGQTVASLAEAFEPYALPERDTPLPTVASLPSSIRNFIGTEVDMRADFDTIARFLRILAGTDSLPWGTRFSDDPWPDRPTGIALAAAGYQLDEKMAQADEAVPTLTVRSRRLGAALALSSLDQFCVLEARYSPVKHASVLPALEEALPRMRRGLPPDMPVDLLSVFARIHGSSADELLALVRDPDNADALGYNAMACLATIGDDGAKARVLLEELGGRPDSGQRGLAYQVAAAGGHQRFLHEAMLREKDEKNLEGLKNYLGPGRSS